MRRFCIKVNGKAFDVEVEEIRGSAAPRAAAPAAPATRAAAPVSAPAPAPAPVPAPAPAPAPAAAPASLSGNVITSPLPGTVLQVLKTAGQSVRRGETVLVIEAMKMENEIVAPEDGVLSDIAVQKGASVQSGDALFSLS